MAGTLTEAMIAEIKASFDTYDTNNDGTISFDEVKGMLLSLDHDASDWRVKEIIRTVDHDGDGCINFPEFLNLMAKNTQIQDECGSEIEQMFKVFDRDGDGYVTHDEIKQVMMEMEGGTDDAEVEAMMKDADIDGDGQVTFKEFEAIMKKTHPGQF